MMTCLEITWFGRAFHFNSTFKNTVKPVRVYMRSKKIVSASKIVSHRKKSLKILNSTVVKL
jgi:hypothetical protein